MLREVFGGRWYNRLMELEDIIDVNEHFGPIYPYVARQVAQAYGRMDGSALEMGPFAGGVSIELARACPGLSITLGDGFPGLLPYFQEKVTQAGLGARIEVREIDKLGLPFDDGSFDLVVFRGALFFWEDSRQILTEMSRVLRRGGLAMAGGGFGAETPDSLIDAVLERSRELNRRLGKRVLSEGELLALLKETGVEAYAYIDRRHGLWAAIRKPAVSE
ncbi:MAG TPA: class I SAM-dependent methyltransferase [Dehalococcoidia bacterium]|nr:class I SAM-dependent methyltransferase [Dehalococcoidia bacterium]